MATRKYDAVCATGEYTDKDGKSKVEWTNVGVVLEGPKGLVLKLKVIPIPDREGNIWIKFFEPKERAPQRTGNQSQLDDDKNAPF